MARSNFANRSARRLSASTLPVPATRLVGRAAEIAALHELIQQPDVRLVTLTGPGGTGKTRLSLELAIALQPDFPEGVYFVELAPINDPALVAAGAAAVLGIPEHEGQTLVEGIKEYLRGRRVLLVLDNFEHVVRAAPLVSNLLAALPLLKVVVTSRMSLRLAGEHEFAILPLEVPPTNASWSLDRLAEVPAVALFIERAQAVDPRFQLTEANAAAVAEICRRLDGLPLALELAAARSKLLPPRALLDRLAGRLALLVGGTRDAPERQQTLRRTIDWSYNLLDEGEQALFRRLAVFSGNWTLDAAETICADEDGGSSSILDRLASLADSSLVRRQSAGTHETEREPRYTMLETMREYALEQLLERGEADGVRQRHAAYYLAFVERAETQLFSGETLDWSKWFELEHDNLLAALDWYSTFAEDSVAAIRFAGVLTWFWYARGFVSEGRGWLERALESQGMRSPEIRERALMHAGLLAYEQGDYGRAKRLIEESVQLCRELGDRRALGRNFNILGLIALFQGDYAQATELFEKSLRLRQELGDGGAIAVAYGNLGITQLYQGAVEQAVPLLEERLAMDRQEGYSWGIAWTLNYLAVAALLDGDPARAAGLSAESLAIFRRLRDTVGIGLALDTAGRVAFEQSDMPRAVELYIECLEVRRARDDRRGIAECLERLAAVMAAQHQGKWAARLLGAAETMRDAIGAPVLEADQGGYDRAVATAGASSGSAAFTAAWSTGRAMSLEEAVALAAEPVPQTPPPRSVGETAELASELTVREVEVLRLVGQGLTNAEIAETLIVSPFTVNAHLRSIYQKLGVTSRRAAVRAVTEKRLV